MKSTSVQHNLQTTSSYKQGSSLRTEQLRESQELSGGEFKTDCPFRYQGQYEDSETGLFYNRFRYYSAEEGVYISQDPVRLAGNNPTMYGYVKDTNSWVDQFGLDCKPIKAKSRKDALRMAKEHAQVPRVSKGGRVIGIDELNSVSKKNR